MTISSLGTVMKKASSSAAVTTVASGAAAAAYRRLVTRGLLSAVAPLPPALAAASPTNNIVLPALQLLTKKQAEAQPQSQPPRLDIKHGIGRITASYDNDDVQQQTKTTTRLTRVSHKAPTRLIPLHNKSSIDKSSGTIVALSTYGGGMLQGDRSSIEIQVDQNACLGIITQGCNRIYKKKTKKQQQQHDDVEPNNTKHHHYHHHHHHQYCQSTLEANVDDDGLLVIAPDPCSLFAQSSFRQLQRINLGQTSNLILFDWFSSGRYKNGEYWDFDNLHAQTQLYINDVLVLQDTTRMDLTIRNNCQKKQSDGNVVEMVETDPAYIGVGNDDCHTFASLILYGDQVNLVQSRCWQLKELFAKQKTRIRERSGGGLVVKEEEELSDVDGHHLLLAENDENDTDRLEALLNSFAGNVYMGISPVNVPSSSSSSTDEKQKQKQRQVHVIRMAATTNEDIYRIMNYVLKPMKSTFGLEYYKDRIRAGQSEIPIVVPDHKEDEEDSTDTPITNRMKNNLDRTQTAAAVPALTELWDEFYKQNPMYDTDTNHGQNLSAPWSSYILSDSAFPIGSFAHSGGLEAAVQVNKIRSTDDLEDFVQAAIRSTLQQTIPFILESHKLITVAQQQQQKNNFGVDDDDDDMDTHNQWKLLNQMCNAVLCGNSIACSASLDQGKSLARVAEQWLSSSSEEEELSDSTSASAKNDNGIHFLTEQQMNSSSGLHLGPTYGAVTASLNIDPKHSCELFGYCLGRDIVSAAVRLNLIGPIKSVKLLEKIQSSVQVGIEASLHALLQEPQEGHRRGGDDATRVHDPAGPANAAGAAAGTSAPVLEAIHPCHDILQTRLFRS